MDTARFMDALHEYLQAFAACGGGTMQQNRLANARRGLEAAFDEAVDARIQDKMDSEFRRGDYDPDL